ncbi:MAG: hypothetical protein P9M03_12150 [Candidatus Theseobacter exili]|nr:hypothetical protein [Candidatus Theseobacter exili]
MKSRFLSSPCLFIIIIMFVSMAFNYGCSDPTEVLKEKLRKKIEDYHGGRELKLISKKFGFEAAIDKIVIKKQSSLSYPHTATVYFKKDVRWTGRKGSFPKGGELPSTQKQVFTKKYQHSVSDDRWYPVR